MANNEIPGEVIMKKNILWFIIGFVLSASFGVSCDLTNRGVKWAYWPMALLPIIAIIRIFAREETSTRIAWIIGVLAGFSLSGFIYYRYLWY